LGCSLGSLTWYDAEYGKADVDEEVGAAACDNVDSDGRDCERVLAGSAMRWIGSRAFALKETYRRR
jgi:hypothetical protein